MGRRSGSSGHWRQHQEQDAYVERAVREGWRSRAVYKLEQIHSKEKLLKPGLACVDLGASPGGWSQFAAKVVAPTGRVWALDRESMEPIVGVRFICGDFTEPQTISMLRSALGGTCIDLVMSDLAPNISGNRAVDQPRAMQLAEEARDFASGVLGDGGDFLVKLFQGEGFEEFISATKLCFKTVRVMKPRASRPESREVYLLARAYGM